MGKKVSYIADEAFNSALRNTEIRVEHQNSLNEPVKLILCGNSKLNFIRANTFSEKEPETLRWIDKFPQDSCFIDVGANVGIYSCYFAKSNRGKAYSVEPSILNLPTLMKNIGLNKLHDKITIVAHAVTDKTCVGNMELSSEEAGGAFNTFAKINESSSSRDEAANLTYSSLAYSLDDLVFKFGLIDKPNFLKIDVDGNELEILVGAEKILKSAQLKSVLIEVDSTIDGNQQKVWDILSRAGFSIESSHSSLEFSGTTSIANEIWVK